MASKEFEDLKEALREPATPDSMKEAAQRFRTYETAQRLRGKRGSTPTLVSLGFKKPYPTSIKVKNIPRELETNPAFYEHLKKIILG